MLPIVPGQRIPMRRAVVVVEVLPLRKICFLPGGSGGGSGCGTAMEGSDWGDTNWGGGTKAALSVLVAESCCDNVACSV